MLVLMTDDERLPDPLAAARLLPKGAMVIVRSRRCRRSVPDWLTRCWLWRARAACSCLIANDAAAGLALWRRRTAPVRSERAPGGALARAAPALVHLRRRALACAPPCCCKFVDAIFSVAGLSPTALASRARAALTPLSGANAIAHAISPCPVYALGGVTARNARLLHGFAGIRRDRRASTRLDVQHRVQEFRIHLDDAARHCRTMPMLRL